MNKIYVNQTALRIQISLNIAITDAKEIYIKCKKPNGEINMWKAKTSSNDIYYDVSDGDLNLPGEYIIWPYVVFNDNKTAAGTPSSLIIYEEGT